MILSIDYSSIHLLSFLLVQYHHSLSDLKSKISQGKNDNGTHCNQLKS